jgi:hypothetical protein
MPSPFPGMDPYLEDPMLWPDLHSTLITFLKVTLNAQLPPQYVAHIDERLYIVEPKRNIYPDVAIVGQVKEQAPRRKQGGATLAVESDPPYVIFQQPAQIREAFINLVRKGSSGRVVATIEILSPSNKDSGNPGRALYAKKQQEILGSSTHLVEIDLLREGQHTVAASEPLLDERGPWDYVVCLHRGGEGDYFRTWPVTVRERLPRILVPLADEHGDVVLDLQAMFQRCYDESGYNRDLDYTQEPAVPLTSEDAEWANTLLQQRGLRKRRRKSK